MLLFSRQKLTEKTNILNNIFERIKELKIKYYILLIDDYYIKINKIKCQKIKQIINHNNVQI